MYLISTFYKFTPISNPRALLLVLKSFCGEKSIRGTIIIASEGINATIVGAEADIQSFYAFITGLSEAELGDLFFQETSCDFMPFQKLKVKIKPEIVTFRTEDLDLNKTGEYINPEDWDQFITRPDVKVIDTRNYYEVVMGSFHNAINPNTNNFTDFIDWMKQNQHNFDCNTQIAMFCTGGVRCEKSTAYMKKLGYKNVYHLKGGIINYLKSKDKNQATKWSGNCFIFDDRVALNSDLEIAS